MKTAVAFQTSFRKNNPGSLYHEFVFKTKSFEQTR